MFCLSDLKLSKLIAFFMLGGASILLFLLFAILRTPQLIMCESTRYFFQWLSSSLFMFVLIFSYPHFMWSYKAAYQQGFAFIFRNSAALIVAPVFLLFLLYVSICSWNQPVSLLPSIFVADNSLRSVGFDLQWSSYKGCGQLLLANLFICQTILAVQHYSMQAYGISLQGARDAGVKISSKQKMILKANLYALAAMNLFSGYTFFAFFNTNDFIYHPVKFPPLLYVTSIAAFAITSALVFVLFVVPNYKMEKRMPPLMMSVPVVSIWVWLQPFAQPFGYQAWIVPLAHGAQYLFVASRVEKAELNARERPHFLKSKTAKICYALTLCFCLIALGFLAFNFFPVLVDQKRVIGEVNCNFFLLAAFVFISLHHYFVDAVLWKNGSQPRMLLQNSAE